MTTAEDIEKAVEQLPPRELVRFRSSALKRMLRLPASAVASPSAPSLSYVPEKPMPTS